MSDSKGAAIMEILGMYLISYGEANARLKQGIYTDDQYEETCQKYDEEAHQAILAILAQEVKQARIDELTNTFKMLNANVGREYFHNRLKDLERLG